VSLAGFCSFLHKSMRILPRMIAPGLQKYRHDRLLGDVWKRPGL
jgi:hypothetical protein